MKSENNQIKENSTYGNCIRGNSMVVTLGRIRYVQQLTSYYHQATARNGSKVNLVHGTYELCTNQEILHMLKRSAKINERQNEHQWSQMALSRIRRAMRWRVYYILRRRREYARSRSDGIKESFMLTGWILRSIWKINTGDPKMETFWHMYQASLCAQTLLWRRTDRRFLQRCHGRVTSASADESSQKRNTRYPWMQ